MNRLNTQLIERGRIAPQGSISREADLPWEAYLQLHDLAENMGILARDAELHALLDIRLGVFERSVN